MIDIEFQVSTLADYKYDCWYINELGEKKRKPPRFDIIAIDLRSGDLCVMELKKGLKALYGASSLSDHLNCYKNSIGKKPQSFMDEMRNLLEQKQKLKLVDNKISICGEEPIFMFVYAYENLANRDFERATFLDISQKEGTNCIKTIFIGNQILKD